MVFKKTHKPFSIEYLLKHYDFYINYFKKIINLESDYNDIILKIIKKNIKYNEKCKNISFVDCLLHKNIKNFVGFTGTAYIYKPET